MTKFFARNFLRSLTTFGTLHLNNALNTLSLYVLNLCYFLVCFLCYRHAVSYRNMIMNWEWCEWEWALRFLKYHNIILWWNLGRPRQTTVTMAGLWDEIRTIYFLIMAQEVCFALWSWATAALILGMRFQVLTGAIMKVTVFWYVEPCSLIEMYRSSRGAYCLHHEGDNYFYETTRRQNPRRLSSILSRHL
jgi:hypothetical protein